MRALTPLWLLPCVLVAQQSAAETILVRADGSGDYATIQAGIDAAADGDLVQLDSGTYRGDGNRDLSLRGKRLVVESVSGNPTDVAIDCEGTVSTNHRGFRIDQGEPAGSTIRGITIKNGSALGDSEPRRWGGALFCEDASLLVERCIIEDCTAGVGGGLAGVGATLEINGCAFRGNQATEGGAIGAVFCEDLVISGCEFIANTAISYAGAVVIGASGPGVIERSLFLANHAEYRGGALYSDGTTLLDVSSCTFAANTALYASAIVSGDVGEPLGTSSMVIRDSIIAFNGPGHATECDAGDDITITCSDVFGNVGGDWTNCLEDQEVNNISSDPLFCDMDNGDTSLAGNSPCLPGGNECGVLMGDQGEGCPVSPVLRRSWGEIKRQFK